MKPGKCWEGKPATWSLIAPLIDGVVADFERTRAMLEHFVKEAPQRNLARQPAAPS